MDFRNIHNRQHTEKFELININTNDGNHDRDRVTFLIPFLYVYYYTLTCVKLNIIFEMTVKLTIRIINRAKISN